MLASLSSALVGLVLAAAPTVTISGDADCLASAGLLARVQEWSEGGAVPEGVRIAIVHDAARLSVHVAREDGRAMERAFEPAPSSCADAELVAAVTVALALDATASSPTSTSSGSEPDPMPPREAIAPRPERTSPPVTSSAPPPSAATRRPTYSVALGLGASIGVVPRPAFDDALTLRVHWKHVAAFVEASTSARGGTTLADGVVDIARLAGAGGACARVGADRLALGLCAGVSAGGVWARARRIVHPRSAWAPWVAVLARAEASVALDARWSIGVVSDVLFGLVRPMIVARGGPASTPVALRTPRVGWRGLVEVRVRWGHPRPPRDRGARPPSGREFEGS